MLCCGLHTCSWICLATGPAAPQPPQRNGIAHAIPILSWHSCEHTACLLGRLSCCMRSLYAPCHTPVKQVHTHHLSNKCPPITCPPPPPHTLQLWSSPSLEHSHFGTCFTLPVCALSLSRDGSLPAGGGWRGWHPQALPDSYPQGVPYNQCQDGQAGLGSSARWRQHEGKSLKALPNSCVRDGDLKSMVSDESSTHRGRQAARVRWCW